MREHVNADHLGVHHYSCTACEFTSANRRTMAHHIAQHTHLGVHFCQVCHEPFHVPSRLDRHVKGHAGVVCALCTAAGRGNGRGRLALAPPPVPQGRGGHRAHHRSTHPGGHGSAHGRGRHGAGRQGTAHGRHASARPGVRASGKHGAGSLHAAGDSGSDHAKTPTGHHNKASTGSRAHGAGISTMITVHGSPVLRPLREPTSTTTTAATHHPPDGATAPFLSLLGDDGDELVGTPTAPWLSPLPYLASLGEGEEVEMGEEGAGGVVGTPITDPVAVAPPLAGVGLLPTACMRQVLSFLSHSDILCAWVVSRTWRVLAGTAAAIECAGTMADTQSVPPWSPRFQRGFPWGGFLAKGGFKSVFQVWVASHKQVQAISVMDVDVIRSAGSSAVIEQEIRLASFASELVSRGVCPNFVETYHVFRLKNAPVAEMWGDGVNKLPHGSVDAFLAAYGDGTLWRPPVVGAGARTPVHDAVFIRMELCQGDAEAHLRHLEPQVKAWEDSLPQPSLDPALVGAYPVDPATDPGLSLVVGWTLQMSMALLACKAHLGMVHADVKLLNFFLVKSEDTTLRYAVPCVDGSVSIFEVLTQHIVKLGDFGSGAVGVKPACTGSFTTFENSPPELLTEGDAAVHGFNLDAWALGLCLLHLLTGQPHYEVYDGVRCPAMLAEALLDEWNVGNGGKAYSDDAPSYRALADAYRWDDAHIMVDQMYCVAVMLGLPSEADAPSEVWSLMRAHLTPRPGRAPLPGSEPFTYLAHRREFALWTGTHPRLARARRRMACIPHSQDLLTRLLAPLAADRIAVDDVVVHPMFRSLHVGSEL